MEKTLKKKNILKNVWKELKKNYFFYLMALPGVIVMLLFSYAPMSGLYLAFEDYTYQGGLFGSEFVGFENFRIFFKNAHTVVRAVRNTVVINMGSILFGMITSVAVAVMFNEIRGDKFRKTTQTLILFPHFLSWIIIGALAETLLNQQNGLLNQMLVSFGLEPVAWSFEPQYWWAIMIIVTVWKSFGYDSIIYYATLTGFDPCLYEAAKVDGANRWQRIWLITIPLLKPTIVLMLLLSIGGILGGSIDQIMGMTKMSPYLFETTDTVATLVYRMTMTDVNFGSSAAASILQSSVGCVLVLVTNFVAKKIDPDYALF